MIPLLSILVALACAGASTRRLWFVTHATAFDPEIILDKLGKKRKGEVDDETVIESLRQAIDAEPTADWERDLLSALAVPEANARAALVNEQLTELDYRIQRWARVPRVCASIATSVGFLLATLVLRRGLSDVDFSGDVTELLVKGLVGDALTVACFGIVGTAFCIAAQKAAKRLASRRMVAADQLVERLEAYVAATAAGTKGVGSGSELADGQPG